MLVFEAKCGPNLTRTLLLACLGWIVAIAQPGNAQDSDGSTLEQLQQQWSELDAQFIEKEELIKKGEGDTQALEQEYKALVQQADELIKKIEARAKSNLKATPNDSASLRALMGIMLNEAQYRRDARVLELGDELIAQGINPQYFEIAARSERLSISAREIFDELIIRQQEAIANDLPRVKLSTTQGDIVLELFENEAPGTVGNFISLVENGYYNDRIFHRVLDGFMAQGGGYKLEDGKEIGGEGPGYNIKCECYTPDRRQHFTGSVSMAHRGKDTGGGQFFLTFSRTSGLDSKFPPDPRLAAHTCFGRVIEGFDVLDKLTRTHIDRSTPTELKEEPIPGITKDKIIGTEMIRKRDHPYQPDKVEADEKPETPVAPSTELSPPETDPGKSGDATDKQDDDQN
jgi:cyclophilin family peptidyl-prolyl cis-trans isomerase